MTLRANALSFFDVTNMTVGAIVGADIYVAAAITAGLLGPASLLAWALAAVLATVLALTLAECSRLVPEVGGPYAYASRGFGHFPGFLSGWSMWIAEICALPVFAIAFTNYLGYYVELNAAATHALRVAFLVVLTAVNVVSVRAAGRVNDALTVLKLGPLLVLVLAGLVYMAFDAGDVADNFTPFSPFGLGEFPTALVLVFWAYAGFELATVPAGEVADAGRTIPRALATGMLIVAAFYLSTNFVLYATVDHSELAGSSTPLILAAKVIFGAAGPPLVAAGAMLSVSGSDESDMLGASRLGYAMAADGMLPHALAAVHSRFRTPHAALIAQSLVAVALTFVDQISDLISFAVFNLSFSFLLCALSLVRLQSRSVEPVRVWRRALPFAAIAIASGLLVATSTQDKLFGSAVLACGAIVYALAAPRMAEPDALALASDPERAMHRLERVRRRFLGALVHAAGALQSAGSSRRSHRRAGVATRDKDDLAS